MRKRIEQEKIEAQILAPYAVLALNSQGRDYPEPKSKSRTDFQRDRDRIIHCRAFRHMMYKTQVFVNHVGDYFRTRLTHTIEVAQIAKSIAKILMLNEDLTEAIALAHDIGHTPFGHAGEEMLHHLMQGYGGFEHNRQGLRVVELLEKNYQDFYGLNLTFEVREGIIKHKTEYDSPEKNETARFLPDQSPPLEAQIVNVADEIAYNNHDIDDGIKSGLLTYDQLHQIPVWEQEIKKINLEYKLDKDLLRSYAVRELIGRQINDVLETTWEKIQQLNLKSVEEVRHQPIIVSFSEEMKENNRILKKFLYQNLYQHYRVIKMQDKAKRFIQRIFEAYMNEPKQLPPDHWNRMKNESQQRVVCDYIAGMTDRYAMDEYQRLFEPYTRI